MLFKPYIVSVSLKVSVRSDEHRNFKVTLRTAVDTCITRSAYNKNLTVINAGRYIW